MKQMLLTKEILQVLKFNFKRIMLFEIAYRLVMGAIYLQLTGNAVEYALKMAGYSYLTPGNIGFFLIKPWTIACILGVGFIGLVILAFEIGVLITVFQGAAYLKKTGFSEMLFGGFQMLAGELRKKNIRLLLLTLVYYTMANLYLLYRVLTHVKPLNFVITELMKQPVGRVSVIVAIAALLMLLIPGIFTFYGCMVEQKNFQDGYRRSRKLMAGHWSGPMMLLVYNVLISALMMVVYGVCVIVAALFVTVFTDKSLSLAVLFKACDEIELVLIFITSIVVSVVNMAAITVQYYQSGNRLNHEPRWDFAFPKVRMGNHKVLLGVAAVSISLSLFFIYDVVYNGSVLADDVLTEVQITAHRGSSKDAPENTMAAIRMAAEQLADYVEIDVQETADGVVVLCHDYSLKRVAGISRPIKAYQFSELVKLDVGAWFAREFKGEKIPSLEEVMQYSKGKMNLNIEIKDLGSGSSLPQKVVSLIDKYGMEEQCVVTSTRLSYLKSVKAGNSNIRTGHIISAAYGDYYSSDHIDFISLRSSFVDEKLVQDAHEKGKAVHAWTVNTKSEMERMKLLGVDNIITDYPVLAREIVYRKKTTENLLEYISMVLK